MQINEIMNTDVKTTRPESTVQEAAKKMGRFRIGSLIVVKNKKLAGIITERDILTKVVAKAANCSKTMVKNAMTKEVIMIDPERDIEDASEVMMEKGIKKLPVIKNENLVGIVTATDIVAAQPKLMEQMAELFLIPGKKKSVAG